MIPQLKRVLMFERPPRDVDEFEQAVVDLVFEADEDEAKREEGIICVLLLDMIEDCDEHWREKVLDKVLTDWDRIAAAVLVGDYSPDALSPQARRDIVRPTLNLLIEVAAEVTHTSRSVIVAGAEVLLAAWEARQAYERGETDEVQVRVKCTRCDSTVFGGMALGVPFCPEHLAEANDVQAARSSALDGLLEVVNEVRSVLEGFDEPPQENRTASPPPGSITERFEALETLRARGLLTDREYAAKRAELLGLL